MVWPSNRSPSEGEGRGGVSVFIIAEAGINHNGDMAAAFKLIDAAQTAGADAVKFQTYDCELLEPPGERRELLRKCQLTHDQFRQLKDHADSVGIEFMSTPFDVGSLEFLVSLGVKRLKISSGDLTNYELLEAANAAGLPAIVSTGMAEDDDIAAALGILYDATLLHCVSAYPTPVEEANLGAMVDLTYFGFPVGISDHSGRWHLPAYAVAAGASVIEVHIRLRASIALTWRCL